MHCNSKHGVAVMLSALFIISGYLQASAQIRWDGGGNDGQWTTAANWVGDILPSSTDDVLLDNGFVFSHYTVTLPPGNASITVKTLVIRSSAGNSIELLLPAASTAAPAFIVSGPGYGITIDAGGIFRNASGISSGQSLQVADSLRINNGGRYVHQTRASHAASVAQILSRAPGTETGILEFDVPGTTGYTISASGRVYGTLVLSANAAGALRTYSSSGSNNLVIRGDFRLNNGVSYNMNLAGQVIVEGDFFHDGQSLNISSGGDNTVLQLKGNVFQSGIMTESAGGLPVIELCGSQVQAVNITGSIINSICLRMNNSAGAILQAPLSLPWQLELLDGKITSSAANLLTLLPGCALQADSVTNDSFIDGPLRKEGLLATDHFLFPVGKGAYQRWIALNNVTGDFTVEYFKGDARQVSAAFGAGIDHISRMEFWTIEADGTSLSTASPELSFADPNSGGVTDLSDLRVALLVNNVWTDGGNIATSGSAGANGSVTGNDIVDFNSGYKYFTLAAGSASANPLPVGITSFSAQMQNNLNLLRWTYEGEDAVYFDLMHSTEERDFQRVARIYAANGQKQYRFLHRSSGANYYKLYTMKKSGEWQQSQVLAVTNSQLSDWLLSASGRDRITVTMSASRQKTEICTILNSSGMVVKQFTAWLSPGINNIIVDVAGLPRGMYSIRSSTNAILFAKM